MTKNQINCTVSVDLFTNFKYFFSYNLITHESNIQIYYDMSSFVFLVYKFSLKFITKIKSLPFMMIVYQDGHDPVWKTGAVSYTHLDVYKRQVS